MVELHSSYSSGDTDELDKDTLARVKELPTDIITQIKKQSPIMMAYVADEFMKHPPNSYMVKILWTEMLFLSLFRKIDRDYLCCLHKNEEFLNAITRFHMHLSKLRWLGSQWIGGLDYSPKSLSTELSSFYRPFGKMNSLYKHYIELLSGKFYLPSHFMNM